MERKIKAITMAVFNIYYELISHRIRAGGNIYVGDCVEYTTALFAQNGLHSAESLIDVLESVIATTLKANGVNSYTTFEWSDDWEYVVIR